MSTLFRRLLPLLASLFVLALGACNDDRFAATARCAIDSDCAAGRACLDGFCIGDPDLPDVRTDGGDTDPLPDLPNDIDPRPDLPDGIDPRPDTPLDIGPELDVPVEPVCLLIEPPVFDFGVLRLGETSVTILTLRNCGNAGLRLDALESTSTAFGIVDRPDDGIVLAAGERVGFVVEAFPRVPGRTAGQVVARASTAWNAEAVAVAQLLFQTADAVTPPCIEALPSRVVLASLPVTSFPLVFNATLRNCGSEPLQLAGEPIFVGSDRFTGVIFEEEIRPFDTVTVQLYHAYDVPGPDAADWRSTWATPSGELVSLSLPVSVRVLEGPFPSDPALAVEPSPLDFGLVDEGQSATRVLTLCNVGTGPLTLDRVRLLTQGDAGNFRIDTRTPAGTTLDLAECIDVAVSFFPTDIPPGRQRSFRATLEITSNDPATPRFVVPLLAIGAGRAELRPCLEFVREIPERIEVPIGTTREVPFSIRNCGTVRYRTLEVQTTITPVVAEISLLSFPGGDLFPGDIAEFTLVVRPTERGLGAVDLRVGTDRGDELMSSFFVSVLDNQPPIECPTATPGASRVLAGPFAPGLTVRPATDIFLDPGLPATIPYTARWRVIAQPSGASVQLFDTTVPGRVRTSLPVDNGTYRFEMSWFTPDNRCSGRSTLDLSTRSSSVGQGLRFVVTWDTPGDPDQLTDPGSDVDMHLARRTRAGLPWNTNDDCYYANRTPVWGDPADPSDNPRLLRDEVNGLGPEIIVIENPTEEYFVGVHYFSDRQFGPSTATLRIFRDGIQVFSSIQQLRRSGDFWIAAAVEAGGTRIRPISNAYFSGFPNPNVVP